MIQLCCECDENAGLTLQRQADVRPIAYCLPHGYQREGVLKQRLENYQLVAIAQQEPTELDLAKARIAELEEKTQPDDGSGGVQLGGADTAEHQLETALRTLELQGKTLETLRSQVGESKEAFNVARRELDRTRGELERTRTELEQTHGELVKARAAPVPATRPDR
jgi:hypothetical protein